MATMDYSKVVSEKNLNKIFQLIDTVKLNLIINIIIIQKITILYSVYFFLKYLK